jgi:ATP-dependent Lhr-like helicase
MSFERLHPSIRHHVVNSLGWPSLRALQEQAIDPILDGDDAVMLAPTAGGKTEAAILPVLSRMLTEDWRGLSALYICPIKALLNNLETRLSQYASFVGRTCGVWHGDVGAGAKKRMRQEQPDILLTTPESIEAQLVTLLASPEVIFGQVRAVIVDEVHAFAGDDRGWHLLGVLSRLQHLTGRRLQRIGLSATIANPEAILNWLSTPGAPRRVVAPDAGKRREADVQLDFVGNLDNAAQVISQLHRGEKRLVFCDSRSRVEDLAARLRTRGTTTFVSHSSLSRESRLQAEQAFAEARDCVIVATSTLELGIDVGDLDRVVQIDAPRTVASFLQRMGRTGRRTDSKSNCLFLATTPESLLQAAGVITLWRQGYVEPVEPPPKPFHILAQQLMALALQRRGITRHDWVPHLATFLASSKTTQADGIAILDHMLRAGLLTEDTGVLWFGERGEQEFGRRHFMDLLAVFASEPLLQVLHGRESVGNVDRLSLSSTRGDKVLVLGGRSWAVRSVDWKAGVVHVVPVDGPGKSRWRGESPAMAPALAQAMHDILCDAAPVEGSTRRAARSLDEFRVEFDFLVPGTVSWVREPNGRIEGWTFAGLTCNSQLAAHLEAALPCSVAPENLRIRIDPAVAGSELLHALRALAASGAIPFMVSAVEEVATAMKFHQCLPPDLLEAELASRFCTPSEQARVLQARHVLVNSRPRSSSPSRAC